MPPHCQTLVNILDEYTIEQSIRGKEKKKKIEIENQNISYTNQYSTPLLTFRTPSFVRTSYINAPYLRFACASFVVRDIFPTVTVYIFITR